MSFRDELKDHIEIKIKAKQEQIEQLRVDYDRADANDAGGQQIIMTKITQAIGDLISLESFKELSERE